MNNEREYSKHVTVLGTTCLKQAIAKWGKPAWALLSHELRRGAVAREIVSALLMQQPGAKADHAQAIALAAYKALDPEGFD